MTSKVYCIKCAQWISIYLFGLLYQAFVIPLFDYCDHLESYDETVEHSKVMSLIHVSYQGQIIACVFHVFIIGMQTVPFSYSDYKILHQVSPPYLSNLFRYTRDVTGHQGRNPACLYVPRVRTNYGKSSLYF